MFERVTIGWRLALFLVSQQYTSVMAILTLLVSQYSHICIVRQHQNAFCLLVVKQPLDTAARCCSSVGLATIFM